MNMNTWNSWSFPEMASCSLNVPSTVWLSQCRPSGRLLFQMHWKNYFGFSFVPLASFFLLLLDWQNNILYLNYQCLWYLLFSIYLYLHLFYSCDGCQVQPLWSPWQWSRGWQMYRSVISHAVGDMILLTSSVQWELPLLCSYHHLTKRHIPKFLLSFCLQKYFLTPAADSPICLDHPNPGQSWTVERSHASIDGYI